MVTASNVTLLTGGSGYAMPMVEFGLPNIPLGTNPGEGVRATGSVTMDAGGVITSVTVENPGFGYYSAPTVTILDSRVAAPAMRRYDRDGGR